MRYDLALKTIKEKIAQPLGLEVKEAARAMRKVVDANMVDGISVVSVQRGEDPRKYVMVAAGGAGPVHAASLAQALDIKKILVNRGFRFSARWEALSRISATILCAQS